MLDVTGLVLLDDSKFDKEVLAELKSCDKIITEGHHFSNEISKSLKYTVNKGNIVECTVGIHKVYKSTENVTIVTCEVVEDEYFPDVTKVIKIAYVSAVEYLKTSVVVERL